MALESKVAQQASVTVQIRPRGLAVSQSQYRLCGRTISTMITPERIMVTIANRIVKESHSARLSLPHNHDMENGEQAENQKHVRFPFRGHCIVSSGAPPGF
jgi:hypothetical protein